MDQLLERDGQATLYRDAIQCDFDRLRSVVNWQQEQIRIFGKVHPVPRLVAYYGDEGYVYAGVDHPPRRMPDVMSQLRHEVEKVAGFDFNAVLCNLYRHGSDGMGYHRDNEPEIDGSCIASLSFGASRAFKMRHRETREVVSVELRDGDLLLMRACQSEWEHAIPKTRRQVGERINLTFRRMLTRNLRLSRSAAATRK